MGIQSNLIYLVTSCTTPKDLWDALKAQFERNTLANKLFLKRQYFTTKMKEGQSVQDHLKNMKEIVDKLAALGSEVAEEEQVVALLISFHFISFLHILGGWPFSLADFRGALH